MGAQGTTCATHPPSLLYEGKSECKRVWVPTLLVELVSLVSLASVSLISARFTRRSVLVTWVTTWILSLVSLRFRLAPSGSSSPAPSWFLARVGGAFFHTVDLNKAFQAREPNLTHFFWFPRCETACCRPPSRTSSCLPVVRFPPVVVFPRPNPSHQLVRHLFLSSTFASCRFWH